ncbi:hypothetical protein TNIN_53711 [Trichonephila inaurata madagascariensis]|uniref:Uncharacterized protein n=1 Tax=Trichonephila inaurata madagascariensis TaxID=2747483 RepID=A0A8X6XFF2_9ARAC|nr:hypothetical protein TNIN_53711 [Trichonephila inaurata madagascariensis]
MRETLSVRPKKFPSHHTPVPPEPRGVVIPHCTILTPPRPHRSPSSQSLIPQPTQRDPSPRCCQKKRHPEAPSPHRHQHQGLKNGGGGLNFQSSSKRHSAYMFAFSSFSSY